MKSTCFFISGLTDMLPRLFQNIKDWCKTNISNQFTSHINMDKMSDFMNLCLFLCAHRTKMNETQPPVTGLSSLLQRPFCSLTFAVHLKILQLLQNHSLWLAPWCYSL